MVISSTQVMEERKRERETRKRINPEYNLSYFLYLIGLYLIKHIKSFIKYINTFFYFSTN